MLTGPAWRDLKWDQKCYQSNSHPSWNQRFDLDLNIIRPLKKANTELLKLPKYEKRSKFSTAVLQSYEFCSAN
jgi:hypothetical protein